MQKERKKRKRKGIKTLAKEFRTSKVKWTGAPFTDIIGEDIHGKLFTLVFEPSTMNKPEKNIIYKAIKSCLEELDEFRVLTRKKRRSTTPRPYPKGNSSLTTEDLEESETSEE